MHTAHVENMLAPELEWTLAQLRGIKMSYPRRNDLFVHQITGERYRLYPELPHNHAKAMMRKDIKSLTEETQFSVPITLREVL